MSSKMPRRIQLQRSKGWRLPSGAVKVDRSTPWGNPWPVGRWGPLERKALDAAGAVGLFEQMLKDPEMLAAASYPSDLSPLRGKHLACWCPPGKPCHADVLLKRANAEPMRADGLPAIALSVRQPWAWAIIHGGKDVENRAWTRAPKSWRQKRGRVAIHAARGMTRREYEDARRFMERLGVEVPPAHELGRGGIVGSVEVAGLVEESGSPWFFGPLGLVLRDPRPCAVTPVLGALGYFRWQRDDRPGVLQAPAKWMLPKPVKVAAPPPLDVQRDFSEIWGGRAGTP